MRLWHSAVIIAVLLAIDLVSKIWIRANVPLYELTTLIPNLIDLTHVQNRGVSFSFLSDLDDSIRLPLLIGISVLAIAGMIIYQLRYWLELDEWTKQGLTWILPGAMGNLVDRGWFGHVTDFSTSVGLRLVFLSITLLTSLSALGLSVLLLLPWYRSDLLKYRKSLHSKKTDHILLLFRWALSSAGRATVLQTVGHKFDPCSAHHSQ